jgi:hypothetical protein
MNDSALNTSKPPKSGFDAAGPLVLVFGIIVGMMGVAAVCMGGLSASWNGVVVGLLLIGLALLLFVQGVVASARGFRSSSRRAISPPPRV